MPHRLHYQLIAVGLCLTAVLLIVGETPPSAVRAQAGGQEPTPTATLIPAAPMTLRSAADSNSPAVWELYAGRPALFLFTSINGWPTRHQGPQLASLTLGGRVEFDGTGPVHGVWFESVVPDVDGTWYAYYHNELPAEVCGELVRTIPRIGTARSRDFGETWEDLGIVLQAAPDSEDCASTNQYFVGGVGDFTAVLDQDARYLYFFFSQYVDRERRQGVSVARMPWAYRDDPVGRVAVWWRGDAWLPPRASTAGGHTRLIYPAGTPIYRASDGWHDGELVDAFWGPSVHWNTHLGQHVMLLNRAQSATWRQEGIYVAFSRDLSNPASWATPQRLLTGGAWYPQVLGLETGTGTDKVAGERARFFLGGRSQYLIQFSR